MTVWRQTLFPPLKLESDDHLLLDILRVASSFAIVIYHFRDQFDASIWPWVTSPGLDNLSLAVDLFFVISGFIIASVYAGRLRSRDDYRAFMIKRFARIYPLHAATLLVFVGLGALYWLGVYQPNHPGAFDARCLPSNLLLVHSLNVCSGLTFNAVSWSISAEMLLYLAFPLMLPLVRRPILLAMAITSSLALVATLGAWSDWDWTRATFDWGILRAIPAFMIGVLAWRMKPVLVRLPAASILFWLTVMIVIIGLIAGWSRHLLLAGVYLIAILGVAASQRPVGRWVRRIAPLGQLTYSIYMLHPILNTIALGFVGGRVLGLTQTGLLVLAIVTMFALVPIAWISLSMFEMPMRRAITRWGVRHRNAGDEGREPPAQVW